MCIAFIKRTAIDPRLHHPGGGLQNQAGSPETLATLPDAHRSSV